MGLASSAYNAYSINVHDPQYVYGSGESVTCKHYKTITNVGYVTLINGV